MEKCGIIRNPIISGSLYFGVVTTVAPHGILFFWEWPWRSLPRDRN
jgi:hypothetical protein